MSVSSGCWTSTIPLGSITSRSTRYKRPTLGRSAKGRPGKHTKYTTTQTTIYTLSWSRDRQALERERRVDGIFPLLSTDASLSAKEALVAYKFQPRLEKRFQQLKSVHQVAPTLCKKVERVEALMFLYFVALIIQALIGFSTGRTLVACRNSLSQGCDHGAVVSWHGCQRGRARLRAPPPRKDSPLPARRATLPQRL